jgi:hypothetical protein
MPELLHVVIVALSLAGVASVEVRVRGSVVDAMGAVIPKARIELKTNDRVVFDGFTDEQGKFSVPSASWRLQIRISAPGFQQIVRTIDISEADVEMPDIRLEVADFGGIQVMAMTSVKGILSMPAKPCDVVQSPASFNGVTVVMRGRVRIDFEDFELTSECGGGIWLEYGRGPVLQPTIWCCGSMKPDDPAVVVQDNDFRKFDRLLRRPGKHGLMATLVGRVDVSPKGGYGHLGASTARLVIQAVADVIPDR